ncbi:hypothetical protein CRE_02683 [Caenorhabditis remanei]|uniref:Uncharacterized protein n=1 Tax=Caenorhabditis remanei TaxID=31234 RepID=E3NHX9_CAERE|nr:hypothetical protein CRE_02683 [Caenorhabditis remanei]
MAELLGEPRGEVPKLDFSSPKQKRFMLPKNPGPRSIPNPVPKPLFTSTPRSSLGAPRRMPPTTKTTMNTSLIVGGDMMTPHENRASRLRRLKNEETRKSFGGGVNSTLDTSLNSSFKW